MYVYIYIIQCIYVCMYIYIYISYDIIIISLHDQRSNLSASCDLLDGSENAVA